jgi:iron complex transport system substrate-binding protein
MSLPAYALTTSSLGGWAKLAFAALAPCGFSLDGAAAQAESVLHLLPARAAVWAIDADAVMVRPGPRLVDGAEALATAMFGSDVTGIDANAVIRRIR